jgi:hypothetical protein
LQGKEEEMATQVRSLFSLLPDGKELKKALLNQTEPCWENTPYVFSALGISPKTMASIENKEALLKGTPAENLIQMLKEPIDIHEAIEKATGNVKK